MSFKVFQGIKFASSDFYEVFEQLQSFRQRLVGLTEEGVGKYLASTITDMVDNAAMKGEPAGKNHLSEAVGKFQDDVKEIQIRRYRNPAVDFEFNVQIMPFENSLYGMIWTEQREWRNLFLSEEWVSEYAFYDGADPDDGLPEDWNERERVWEGILSPDHVPAQHGVLAELSYNFYWPEWGWIEPHFPTFERRVEKLATRQAINDFSKSRIEPGEKDTSKYVEVYMNAKDWLQTDEGKAAVLAASEAPRSLIPPVLTRFVCDGWSPE